MAEPSERVYVTGLPEGLDDAKVKAIFEAYGTLKDCKSLAGKRAAILNFATMDEAKWVVDNLDGNMPEGITTPVKVEYSWSRTGPGGKGGAPGGAPGGPWGGQQSRPGPYGACGGGGKGGEGGARGSVQMLKRNLISMGVLPGTKAGKGAKLDDSCQLYIKGLPADCSDRDLADIFSPFGAIPPRGIKAMLDGEGQCTGVGFVDYMEAECAAAAVKAINGAMCSDGTSLRVCVKNSTKKGSGGGK